MNFILLFKALHIIGAVAWFGGLFYLVRIFVYHREALDRPEAERKILIPQYSLMELRAYKIICNPAMMLTWTFGSLLIYQYGWDWFKMSHWLHVKLVLLIGLSIYHDFCKKWMYQLQYEATKLNSFKYRLLNEVPTLFLVSIVLLAVFKNFLNFAYAFGAVLLFGICLYVAAKWYKTKRQK